MNAVAPVTALAVGRILPQRRCNWSGLLFTAMVVQLAVLWAWHAPPAVDAAARSPALHFLMQASLFLCALWFWSAVFFARDDGRWRAILALLLTSKLFCLLGALPVFSPRFLYPGIVLGHGEAHAAAGALADQQLAALLMLVACPATYVLAGIVIVARWFGALEVAAGGPRFNPEKAPHVVL